MKPYSFLFVALLHGLASACAMQEAAVTETAGVPQASEPPAYGGGATAIQLDKAVHFSSPDGQDLIAAPGRYQVEPTEEAQLTLVPEGNQPPLQIAAMVMSFDLDVAAPAALTIPTGEDAYHVVLLLPGGTAVAGIGSYSGTQTRGPIALGSAAVKTTLNAKLADIKAPMYAELPKEAPKFERRASDLSVEPGQRTSNFEECRMGGSGYVGSVIAQQTVAVTTRGALPFPPPMLAGLTSRDGGFVFLTQAPGAKPSTPNTGTTSYVTTNPRTAYLRDVPRSFSRCVFGSTTVVATGMLPFQAGERVQLLVTSITLNNSYVELWIEDTYELTARSGKSLTFPKVIVAAATAGVLASDWIRWHDLSKRFAERMRNGVFVGYTLKVAGKRLACQYKPDSNNFGQGTVTCPPGMPWPLQQ
jgi:hypothetical protein